ncbi:MAG TPA: hypothetical protein VFR70_09230, partial [Flavobacterium sp.]|nr:hypothetical protein [Flavobacterium sp.]
MKTIAKNLILSLSLIFFGASCSSDDDSNDGGNGGNNGSRAVKYEITGNFSGEKDVSYSEAGGGFLNEDITTLPGVKEFTAAPNATGAAVSASGNGGQPGQTLTAKIYIGGQLQRELTATADNSGLIFLNP